MKALILLSVFWQLQAFSSDSLPAELGASERSVVDAKLQKYLKDQLQNIDQFKIQSRVNRFDKASKEIESLIKAGHFYTQELEAKVFDKLSDYTGKKLNVMQGQVHSRLKELGNDEAIKKAFLSSPKLWKKAGVEIELDLLEAFEVIFKDVRKNLGIASIYSSISYKKPTGLKEEINNVDLAVKKYSHLLGGFMEDILKKNIKKHGKENGLILPMLRFRYFMEGVHNPELSILLDKLFNETESLANYKSEVDRVNNDFDGVLVNRPVKDWAKGELLQRGIYRALKEDILQSAGMGEAARLSNELDKYKKEQMKSLGDFMGMYSHKVVNDYPKLQATVSGGGADPGAEVGAEDLTVEDVPLPGPAPDTGGDRTVGISDDNISDGMIAEFIALEGGNPSLHQVWKRGDETGNGKRLYLSHLNSEFGTIKIQTYPVIDFDGLRGVDGGGLTTGNFQDSGELIYPLPDDYFN